MYDACMVSVFEISDLGIWSFSVYLIKDVYHPYPFSFIYMTNAYDWLQHVRKDLF